MNSYIYTVLKSFVPLLPTNAASMSFGVIILISPTVEKTFDTVPLDALDAANPEISLSN